MSCPSGGGVQHEVALVPDELEHFRQVEALERRDVVVALGPDRDPRC